jgi:hypothetical protein
MCLKGLLLEFINSLGHFLAGPPRVGETSPTGILLGPLWNFFWVLCVEGQVAGPVIRASPRGERGMRQQLGQPIAPAFAHAVLLQGYAWSHKFDHERESTCGARVCMHVCARPRESRLLLPFAVLLVGPMCKGAGGACPCMTSPSACPLTRARALEM